MRFELLGPVRAVAEGGPLPLGGPKQRALLACLLLERGRAIGRDSLVDTLWGEQPPESATASLQVYVHGLRRALGAERIVTVGSGYRAALEPGELDVDRFEQLLARTAGALDRDAPAAALDDVDAALALWRGSPLADLRDQPLATAAAPPLEDLRLRALELRGAALLALGEHEALVPELERLIVEHPYRERLREQQILALYRSGRQKDALDAYRSARTMLVDELGVDPGPGLQELERAILRHDAGLQAPATATRGGVRLPAPPTPLVGRRLEIAAVEALLREDARLVTLTGPGGTGKTRLALAVAESFGPSLRDGAAFVDLSAVTTAAGITPAVARALAVAEDELVEHLRDRSLLLVLDNLEQLGPEVEPVAVLLAAAPRLRILATSRVPLRLSGEHDYAVPPLPVPDAAHGAFEELVANDAVRLFAARARAVDASFAVTEDTLGGIVAVCLRLDGLPLALELAATWVKVLSPTDIARRLGNALDLLVSGARDLPPRQRTLRATLDWSHDLLREPEQRLLAELSVFAGSWTVDDVEAVVGRTEIAGLATLADHSLIRRRGDRFTMLETIREYAAELLGPRTEELRRRHAEHFVALTNEARKGMLAGGEEEAVALRLIDDELENVRVTLDFLHAAGEGELEAGVAVALRWYWMVRGLLAEGSRVCERIVAITGHLPRAHADAISGAGVFNVRLGLRHRATEQLETARGLYAGLGDADEEGRCIAELGALAVDDRELQRAAELFAESAALFERIGNAERLGVALSNLAAVETMRGRHDAAAEHSRRAIDMQRETRDLTGLGVSLANFGRARLDLGDQAQARPAFREAFDLALRLDYRILIAHMLGDAARLSPHAEQTAQLVGAAAGLFEAIDMPPPPEELDLHVRTLAPVRASLGDDRVEELLAQGRDAPVDRMIDEARVLI